MSLLSQYNDATNGDFRQKLIAALSKKAAEKLQDLVIPTSPEDPDKARYIMFARKALDAEPDGIAFIARALAVNGINNDSLDGAIQTAVDANFDAMALLFDPEIGV